MQTRACSMNTYGENWLHGLCSQSSLANIEQVWSQAAVQVIGSVGQVSMSSKGYGKKLHLNPSIETMIAVFLNSCVPFVRISVASYCIFGVESSSEDELPVMLSRIDSPNNIPTMITMRTVPAAAIIAHGTPLLREGLPVCTSSSSSKILGLSERRPFLSSASCSAWKECRGESLRSWLDCRDMSECGWRSEVAQAAEALNVMVGICRTIGV